MVDLEPIPVTLGARWENSPWTGPQHIRVHYYNTTVRAALDQSELRISSLASQNSHLINLILPFGPLEITLL